MQGLGRTDDEIMTATHATKEEVDGGILNVRMYLARNSRAAVEAKLHEQAMIALDRVGTTLTEAQLAERCVDPGYIDPETGEVKVQPTYEPDHTTRLDAVRATATLVQAAQKAGPGVVVNANTQNNTINSGTVATSFEERLRLRREALGLSAPPGAPQLPAAPSTDDVDGVDGDVEDADLVDIDDDDDDDLDRDNGMGGDDNMDDGVESPSESVAG